MVRNSIIKRPLGPAPWALAIGPSARALENAVTNTFYHSFKHILETL